MVGSARADTAVGATSAGGWRAVAQVQEMEADSFGLGFYSSGTGHLGGSGMMTRLKAGV